MEEVQTTVKPPKPARKRQNSQSGGLGGGGGIKKVGKGGSGEVMTLAKVLKSGAYDDKLNGDDGEMKNVDDRKAPKSRKRSDSKGEKSNSLRVSKRSRSESENILRTETDYKVNGGRSERQIEMKRAKEASARAAAAVSGENEWKLGQAVRMPYFGTPEYKTVPTLDSLAFDFDPRHDTFAEGTTSKDLAKDVALLAAATADRKYGMTGSDERSTGRSRFRRRNESKSDSQKLGGMNMAEKSEGLVILGAGDVANELRSIDGPTKLLNHKSDAPAKRAGRRKAPPNGGIAAAPSGTESLLMQQRPAATVLASMSAAGGLPLLASAALQLPESENNSYTEEVLKLITEQKRPLTGSSQSVSRRRAPPDSDLDLEIVAAQLCDRRYQVKELTPETKILEATSAVTVGQVIGEYTGSVMLREEYEHNKAFDLSFPFVLCYTGLDHIELCIDASISTNHMKYLRCSCSPNVKVAHMLMDNGVRFFIQATKNIAVGTEIAVPFNYDYRKCSTEVSCACGKSSCQVARYYKNRQANETRRVGKRKSLAEGEKTESKMAVEETNRKVEQPSLVIGDRKKSKIEPQNVDGKSQKADMQQENMQEKVQKIDHGESDVVTKEKKNDQLAANVERKRGQKAEQQTVEMKRPKRQTLEKDVEKASLVNNVESTPPPTPKKLRTRAAATQRQQATTTTVAAGGRHGRASAADQKQPISLPRASKSAGNAAVSTAAAAAAAAEASDAAKKSREQRKIEAIERTFEKIEQRRQKVAKRDSTDQAPPQPTEELKSNPKNLRVQQKKSPVVEKVAEVPTTKRSGAIATTTSSRRNCVSAARSKR
jgi:hypothetical protein